jgi:hypothetical protein
LYVNTDRIILSSMDKKSFPEFSFGVIARRVKKGGLVRLHRSYQPFGTTSQTIRDGLAVSFVGSRLESRRPCVMSLRRGPERSEGQAASKRSRGQAAPNRPRRKRLRRRDKERSMAGAGPPAVATAMRVVHPVTSLPHCTSVTHHAEQPARLWVSGITVRRRNWQRSRPLRPAHEHCLQRGANV